MMKFPPFLVALLCAGTALSLTSARAADPDPAAGDKQAASADSADKPAAGDIKAELAALVQKVQAKINAGKSDEKDFTDELAQFDKILAEHKGEKTDDVSQVLFMKAQLYTEVFKDDDKAIDLIKQLKSDYPDTKLGMNADRIITMIQRQAASDKIQKALVAGATFPDFDEKDIDGKSISVANYKGKVVLVDFWATWCGPCVGEMPNVIKAYQKYHDKGFEIIGISLDQDKDALTTFIKDKNMTWQQYFDGQGWQNKIAQKYGINSIPMNYLIGKDGKIINKSLRGDDLDAAVNKAVTQ